MENTARTMYDGIMARPLTKPGRLELRISEEESKLLDKLTAKLGITKSAVYAMALRDLARKERIIESGEVAK